MDGAQAPALLAVLAGASSVAAEPLDGAGAEGGDEPPAALPITPASRAAWSAIFRQHVLTAKRVGDADDMLLFVRVPVNREEPFFALRNDSKQLPPPESADVNWEESCYLNLIMHNIEYTLEVSVRQRAWSPADNKFVSTSLKKLSKKVWAAPNHASLDGHAKAESVELTYPFIYFRVDDYEEIWRDVRLEQPDQIIAVELFASGPIAAGATFEAAQSRHKLFSGALSFEAIQHAVKAKSSAFSLSGPPAQHFFKLRGPRGKGTAQLCVKRAGADAPGFGAWALSVLRVGEADVSGPFTCSITWLSVSWHSIVRDILLSAPPKK